MSANVIERIVPLQAVSSVVNAVFDTFLTDHKYLNAIELARSYAVSIDKINNTIYMEFMRSITTGDIEKAMDRGKRIQIN